MANLATIHSQMKHLDEAFSNGWCGGGKGELNSQMYRKKSSFAKFSYSSVTSSVEITAYDKINTSAIATIHFNRQGNYIQFVFVMFKTRCKV